MMLTELFAITGAEKLLLPIVEAYVVKFAIKETGDAIEHATFSRPLSDEIAVKTGVNTVAGQDAVYAAFVELGKGFGAVVQAIGDNKS